MTTIRRSGRLLALVLVTAILPACYSSSGKTYTPPGGGGAGNLFSEGFFPWPNGGWTGPTTSNATAVSFFTGTDYYLRMTGGTRPGSASTTTTMSFAPQALTFVVSVRYSATSALADTASIQIVDNGGPPNVLAQAVLNTSTGMITLTVGAGAPTNVSVAAGVFAPVTFKIDGSNNATWNVGATTTAPAAFGAQTTKVQFSASYAAGGAVATPTFDFDNLSVNNP